jgi:hypothetical protein
MNRAVLVLVGVLLVVAASAALLYAAWAVEESREPVRTVVVQNPQGDDTFVVELQEREGEDLIIQCSEDRFQDAFKHFARFLGIDREPLDGPGGAMLLARFPDGAPESLQAPKRALVELLKRHSPRRVVLVAHSECLYYDVIGAWKDDLDGVKARQEQDLREARDLIASWYPKARIETYYAMKTGSRLAFNPLELEEEP